MSEPSPPRPRTRLAHAGSRRSEFGEASESLFLTQSFLYPDAETAERYFTDSDETHYVYSRFANPNLDMFCDRLRTYEGAPAARATASGMAAVTAALLCQLEAGDHVVASRVLFGSCQYVIEELLPRFGIGATLIDGTDPDVWTVATRPNTRVYFLETPANPTLEIIDIAHVAEIARKHGVRLVVDNALASPVCQQPLSQGADIVVYSATKHIDGQGRCLGGAVLGDKGFIGDELTPFLRHTGAALSPFNAWTFVKSLETLELRVQAQAETALILADAAAGRGGSVRVRYPGQRAHPQHEIAARQMRGGGTLLTLEFAEGKSAAFRFLNALRVIRISNNFGDAKSVATHPATTTHSRFPAERRKALGITDGLVRLSAGLEDSSDLVDDVSRALDAAGA